MGKNDFLQIAAAGEHYVAFRLAQHGFVVAVPRGGSPTVDLLVSNSRGTRMVAIQVKTTEWALRERGRGQSREPHHLEFPLGAKAANHTDERFVYAFVDLRGKSPTSVPDVYIVPSKDIQSYCGDWAAKVPLVRWHPTIESADRYKGAWHTISQLLE